MVLGSCQHVAPAVQPLTYKPIEYFEFNCARCHGSYGSSYGDSFGEGMSDPELIEFVGEMAAGPGQSAIEGPELDAQVAFHRSLVINSPFIAWTGWDGETLSGEVTAGSTVKAQVGKQVFDAVVKGEQWSLNALSIASSLGNAVIIADQNGAISQLKLSESAFSHRTALPE